MDNFLKFLILLSILCVPIVHADNESVSSEATIYKSIDEKGNVTYSQEPPKNDKQATSIDIAPPPSDERVKAAQDRHDRNQEAATILDENRKKRDEITAKENQLKRENQRQGMQQQQAERNNSNDQGYGYPYYPAYRRPNRPGHKPRPPTPIPPIHRPVPRR